MRRIRTVFLPALLFPMAILAGARAAAPADVLDPSFFDRSVEPCVDFYQFACGGWLKANPIPADQSRWGQFTVLDEKNKAQLREILEAAASARERSAEEQKVGDYYAAC